MRVIRRHKKWHNAMAVDPSSLDPDQEVRTGGLPVYVAPLPVISQPVVTSYGSVPVTDQITLINEYQIPAVQAVPYLAPVGSLDYQYMGLYSNDQLLNTNNPTYAAPEIIVKPAITYTDPALQPASLPVVSKPAEPQKAQVQEYENDMYLSGGIAAIGILALLI